MFGISEKERAIARHFIIVRAAKNVLERDISIVHKTELKLSSVYKEMMTRLSDQVSLDLREVKQEMVKAGVRVAEDKKVFTIFCGGYEEQIHLDPVRLRNLVTKYLMELLNNYGNRPI